MNTYQSQTQDLIDRLMKQRDHARCIVDDLKNHHPELRGEIQDLQWKYNATFFPQTQHTISVPLIRPEGGSVGTHLPMDTNQPQNQPQNQNQNNDQPEPFERIVPAQFLDPVDTFAALVGYIRGVGEAEGIYYAPTGLTEDQQRIFDAALAVEKAESERDIQRQLGHNPE